MPVFKDLAGQRFGMLTVLSEHEKRLSPNGKRTLVTWHCKCDCGNDVWVPARYLSEGTKTSCGCSKGSRLIDLSGKRYGYLTVLDQHKTVGTNKNVHTEWLCRCDCGTEKWVSYGNLISGGVKSCGCKRYELNYQHQHGTNKYDMESFDYGVGKLKSGEQFIFDKEDYDIIKQFYWRKKEKTDHVFCEAPKGLGYNRETVYLHRLVMGIGFEKFTYDKVVDHINGNPLDNRKSNLRIVSQLNNMENQRCSKITKTGIPGITVEHKTGGYIVRAGRGMKRVYGGFFMNLDDAIKRNNELREELYGEYSYTNSQKISKENTLHG